MSKKDESVRRPAKGPRIGLAQMSPVLGDVAANMERHRAAVDKAVADECDLLVFPELSLTGYRLKDSVPDVAITRDSETWKQLEALSEKVAVVVGLVEESPDHRFFNSAAYFEGGRCLAVHRKSYLPTYGMFDESRYFARGNRIQAFDTKIGRVAMLVCEDMLHPSAVTIAACDGATLLVVPSASPARGVTGQSQDEGQSESEADANARSWEAYGQVMARSFGLWVAYCNRAGVEDGVSFWGGSEVFSPAGERAVKAAYYEEDSVSCVMAADAVRRRRIVNPLVRDEDLDLTINELSRIRGRSVDKKAEAGAAKTPAREQGDRGAADKPRWTPRSRDNRPARDGRDGDAPPRRFDRDAPPRSFDRDAPPRPFDRDAPPRRFDRDAPPRRFDRDDDRERRGGPDFRPKGPYQKRGGPPRGRDEGPGHRFDGPPKGRFDGPPKGRFDGPPKGRFEGPGKGRDDDRRGGGFGPPRGGGFGPPRGGGFGPPRGRFPGPPRGPMGAVPGGRDDRGGGSFGGRSSFGDDPARPRQRERPEPSRKPFHKGAKPRGRGRKGD